MKNIILPFPSSQGSNLNQEQSPQLLQLLNRYCNTIIVYCDKNNIISNLMKLFNIHIHSKSKFILPLTAMFSDTTIARIAHPINKTDCVSNV